MSTEKEKSDDLISIDLGQQFTMTMIRLIGIQVDLRLTKKYQAKILAKLESRPEEEVLSEMKELTNEFHEEEKDFFYKSLGLSKETLEKFKSQANKE